MFIGQWTVIVLFITCARRHSLCPFFCGNIYDVQSYYSFNIMKESYYKPYYIDKLIEYILICVQLEFHDNLYKYC